MNQSEMVLKHIYTNGSITPLEAMQEYGIMRLSGRIYDLKNKYGINIKTECETSKNRYGKTVRYSRYRIGE